MALANHPNVLGGGSPGPGVELSGGTSLVTKGVLYADGVNSVKTEAAFIYTDTTNILTVDSITSNSSTDLTLAAGSGNQNLVLTPSGTGRTNTALGIQITGNIGGSGTVARSDAQAELRNPGGTGHALLSIVQTKTPGDATDEAAVTFQAFDSASANKQMASTSAMWVSANSSTGYAVLRFNATKSGGTLTDVAFRIFGGAGAAFFAADDTAASAPGDKLVKITGGLVFSAGSTVANGISWNGDTDLFRTSAGLIRSTSSLQVEGSGGVLLAGSGPALRVEGSGVGTNSAGPGVEIGYSSGGATGFVQAYNRTGAVFIPLAINTTAATISGPLTLPGGATFLTTSTALTNGSGAQVATMTNGPTAGNPTKWIGINDNGTTRYIPSW